MVATLEVLKSGVFNVCRKFEDGSVVYFKATAAPSVLRGLGLSENHVYNLDTKTIINEELVQNGTLTILEDEDIKAMKELDVYLNGGVNGDIF